MAGGFSMGRGVTLRSRPGRGCKLSTSRFSRHPLRPVTAGRWCRTRISPRRGGTGCRDLRGRRGRPGR
jgi:hypothetical protein